MEKETEQLVTPKLLGLSEDEFQIYTVALARRVITLGEIELYTKKENVSETINQLQKKGLLKGIPGKVEKYYGIPPLLSIQEGTKTFRDSMSNINDTLSLYLDQILAELDTEIVKSTETIVQLTDSHTSVLKDNIAQIDEQITNTLVENLDGIREVNKNTRETLLNTVSNLQDDTNAMIQLISKKINEFCEETDTEIKNQSSNSKDEIVTTLEKEKTRCDGFITPLKEDITQKIQNCQEGVNTIEQSIDDNIDEALTVSLEKLRTQISGLRERFTKKMSKSFEQIKELPKTLGERTLATISTQKDEFDEDLSAFETRIQEEFSAYIEEYQKNLTVFITKAFDKVNVIFGQYKTSIDEIASEYVTNINLSKQEVGTAVSNFEATIQKTLIDEMVKYQEELTEEKNKWVKNLEEIVETIHSNSLKVTEEIAQLRKDNLIEYEKNLDTLTDTHENEITTYVKEYRDDLSKLGTQIENIVTQFSEVFMKELTNLFQSISSQMTSRFEEFRNIAIRADNMTKQTFDELKENSRKFNRELEGELFNQLSENRDILIDNSKIIQEGVDLLLDAHLEKTKEVYEQITEFNNSIVASHSETRETIKNDFIENLSKIISDYANDRFDKLDKLYKHLVDGANQLTTTFTNEITNTLKEIETLRDANIEDYTSVSNEFKNAVSEHLKGEVTAFDQIFGDLKSTTTKTIDKEKETLDNLFNTLKTDLSNKVSTLQDSIHNESDEAKKQIQELLEEESNKEKMIYETYSSTLQERIDELIEKMSSYLDEVSRKISDTLQSQIDEIEPELVRFRTSIIQDSESRLRDLSEDVQDILTKISTDILNFTSSMNQIITFFTSNANSLFEELQTTVKNIESKFFAYIESYLTETRDFFEDYTKEIIKTSDASKIQVTDEVKGLKEELSDFFEKIDTHEMKIESLFQSISELLQTPSEVLLSESDEIERTVRDSLTTCLTERALQLQGFKEKLSKRFTKSKKTMSTDVESIKKELEYLFDDKWEDEKQKAYKNVIKLLNKCEKQFNEELTTEIFENQLDKPLKNGDVSLEELPITLKNRFESLKSNFDEKSQDILQKVNSLGAEIIDERQKIKQFKGKSDENLKRYANLITRNFEQFSKNVQEFLTPKITALKDDLVKLKESITTEISEKIIRSLTNASKNSELRISTTLMNFTSMLNNLAKGFADNLDLRFKEFSDEYQTSFEEFSQIFETQLKELKETTDSIEKYNKDLIEKQLENNKAEIGNIENEILKQTEILHNTRETSLKTLEKTLLQTLDERTAQAIDTHQNIKESTEIAYTETYEALADELHTLNQTIISAFQSEMDRLNKEIKNLAKELDDVQTTHLSEYEELLAMQVNTITNMVEGLKSLLDKQVEDTKIASSEYVDTTKKLYAENIEAVNKEMTTALKSLYEDFVTETQSLQKEINQRFTDQISVLKKEITALKQEYKKQIANAKRQHSRALNTLKKVLSEDFAKYIENTESQIVETQNDISYSMTSHLMMYEFSNAFATGKMAYLSKNRTPQLINSMNETKESFVNVLVTQESELDEFFQSIQQEWTNSLNLSQKMQKESLESFEDLLKETIESNDTTIENIVSMIRESTLKMVDLHLTTSKERRATLRKIINEQLSKVLQEVNAIALSKIEVIETTKQQISEEIENTIETTREDTEDFQTKYLQQTKEKTLIIGKEILATVNKISENITQKILTVTEEIKKLIEEHSQKTSDMATLVDTEITNTLEQNIESLEKRLTKLKTDITTIRESRTQLFEEHVQTLEDSVTNAMNTNLEELLLFVSAIQGLSQSWTDQIAEGFTDSTNQLGEETRNYLAEESEKKMKEIARITGELGEELSTSQNIIESTKNDLQNGLKSLSLHQSQNIDEFNKSIKTKFVGDIKVNVENLGEVNRNTIQETRDKIQEAIKNTVNYEVIVKDLWDEIQEIIPVASDLTWYLSGGQLDESIKAIIERTKRSLTIITPNIKDVPLNTIKKLESSVQVLVITQPDLETEEERRIVQELYQLGNVRVKKKIEINYRAIWRDHEEVLIAPKGLETLGIISEDPNYVAMIDKILRPEVARSADITPIPDSGSTTTP